MSASETRIVYSRFSAGGRLVMGIVGIALFLVFAAYLRSCLETPPVYKSRYDRHTAYRPVNEPNQLTKIEQPNQSAATAAQMKWIGLFVLGVPSLVIALFNLYFIGPNQIVFDFIHQQYTCVAGFPLMARRITGDFADIEGLRLTGGRYQNPSVVLVWKQPERPVYLLKSFPNERSAREMLRSLSAMLDVSGEA